MNRLPHGLVGLYLFCAVSIATADLVFWEGDVNDNWNWGDNWSTNLSCGPVICFQLPPDPDDDVAVIDDTFGNHVNLTDDVYVKSLFVSNGMTVRTNGFNLDVSWGGASATSLLDINGAGATVLVTDNSGGPEARVSWFQVRNGGALRLSGNPYVHALGRWSPSKIEPSSALIGNGTVRFDNSSLLPNGVAFTNDGSIMVNGHLRLEAGVNSFLDLDGVNGDGLIDVTDTLVSPINRILTVAGPLADPFDGTIKIGHNDQVDFENAWTLGATNGGTIEMRGRHGLVGSGIATLSGADVLISHPASRIEAINGTARFEANLIANAGTLAVSDNTTTIFAGDADFSANAALDKHLVQNHHMIVQGTVQIGQSEFDLDGDGTNLTTIRGGTLIINSDQIDGGDNHFNGTIDMIAEAGSDHALLAVRNLGGWFMDGTLRMDGTMSPAVVLSGSLMRIGDSGFGAATLEVDGPWAQILTDVTFGANAAVALNTGARLSLVGDTVIRDGAEFAGPGELHNRDDMVVATGNSVDVTVVNHADIAIDNPNPFASGSVTLHEFQQTSTGQVVLNATSPLPNIGDRVTVTTSAQLDGTLSISGQLTRGDSRILITAASIHGEFATVNTPTPDVGDRWRVVYEPTQVVVLVTASGDFNIDGDYDCLDINALVAQIASGTGNLDFDLTGDGSVDGDDLSQWLVDAGEASIPSGNPFLPGDANLDGVVDGQDLDIWNTNKFAPLAAWCSGDFNADGVVNGRDFLIWNSNKFMSAHGVPVPEPSVALFVVAGFAGLVGGRSGRCR